MHTEISQKEDSRHGQSRQLLHFLDKETIKLRGIDRTKKFRFECLIVIVVQLPSSVRLFATPWTTTCQASLSLTIFWSFPKT